MSTLTQHPATRFGTVTPAFAGTPAEYRHGSRDRVRLLVARPTGIAHRRFPDLVEELRPGDALVVNTSATVNGQVDAVRVAGGRRTPIVLHAATALDDGDWVVELRTAPDAAAPVLDASPGDVIEGGPLGLLTIRSAYPPKASRGGAGNRLWRVGVDTDARAALDLHGRPIAYGYLDGRWPLADYQTVFAQVPGSSEMASAARPFTSSLVTTLTARGVLFAPIVLHTGVSSQEAGEPPQPERFEVSSATAALLNHVRSRGGRLVAVGTTATRAVESAVESTLDGGRVVAARGWTERVITPADPPRVIDGLLTGWHDAHASHLLLVEAVAGAGLTQRAYDAALAGRYAWHEFGDSCLLLPSVPRR